MDGGPPDTSPAGAALAPFLVAAEADLEGELAGAGTPVLPSARRDLVALLSRRLTTACLQVLVHERQALDATSRMLGAPAAPLDASAAGWRERFEQYPVLAPLMARTVSHWREHVRELLSRLAEDRALLGTSLLGGRPPPALAEVNGDAGDLHGGGRSVAVLRFEDGSRVVYKPKDLRVTRGVLELCAFLNEAGLPLPLHVRTLLPREGYAWEEFVPAAPCRTAAEVERFYFRMGMLLRLMQLLEARDLWLDNLVAAGEHPVFIDLEMVLQPRRRPPAAALAEREVEAQLRESVVELGILAAPVRIAVGLPAEELGALTPARAFLHPLRCIPAHEEMTGLRRPSRDGHVLWTHGEHAPTLDGEPVRAVDHLDALLEGYRAMHAALRTHRAALLEAAGPLARLAGLPVRYIHWDTWTCYRLIQAGLTPPLLANRERYKAAFEGLLRGAAARPDGGAEQAAVQMGLEAVRERDVPYLLCRTDGDALLGPDGRVVHEGFFEGTALDRARLRLQELDAFPLARHEDLLRSTLAAGRHAPPRRTRRHEAAEELAPPDWLAEAVALGDLIVGEAVRAEGRLAWPGLTYDPFHDLRWVEVLPPDLLTGSTGIALVLAELYAASGQERFRDAALGALGATREVAAQARSDGWNRTATGARPLEVGAFRGAGAHLYVLHRCAAALEAPELAGVAQAYAASLPLEALCDRATPDVVTGAAGLLLALIACGDEPAARTLAEALGPKLTAAAGPPAYPADAHALDGLPDLPAGLALCAARMARRFGQVPRWSPLAVASGASVGRLLARLSLVESSGEGREPLRAQVLRTVDGDPSCSASERLEALEVALTAAQALGDPAIEEHAARLGRAMLVERRTRGRWFPDRLEADRHALSAVWGLSAIAHAFLRLHQPARWPSIRLLPELASTFAGSEMAAQWRGLVAPTPLNPGRSST